MQFGLLYEAQRPFEGTTVDWNTLYKETLEQCVLAEKMGFDNLWFVEHHFLTGFSGSPCPEVLLGALSQLTKRIRIGFGVCILPYHHPVGWPSASRCSTSSPTGASSSAPGARTPTSRSARGSTRATRGRCGRSRSPCSRHLAVGRVLLGGQVLEGADPPRAAEAVPEAAPAPVSGVHADRELRRRRRQGHRRAVLGDLRHDHPRGARQAVPGRVRQARPSAPSSTSLGQQRPCLCGENNGEARELAALSLKTFFGPDKPYIRDRINAYEELLESWGGVPDT